MLEKFAVAQIFVFILVFCRVGAGVMIFPGFGESYVPATIRLVLALMIALALTPAVQVLMPSPPATVIEMTILVAAEILIGLFIGAISRTLLSTMHMLGTIISFQSNLSSATMYDPSQAGQGTAFGNLLGLTALMVLFSLDLHHLMLRGLTDSYTIFPPGRFPPIDDFSDLAARTMSGAFMMAVKLSSPFLVVGVVVNLAAGILTRLMPTMQVFFVMMAPQILFSFFLLMATITSIMLWYMNYLEANLGSL